MKEIIYLQLGKLSNHAGAHFWNSQLEERFEPGRDRQEDEDPYVDHDVSFREGENLHGQETFCPRLVLFDLRDNLGGLSNHNEVYPEPGVGDMPVDEIWTGPFASYIQDPIPRHRFEDDDDDDEKKPDQGVDQEKPEDEKAQPEALQMAPAPAPPKISYWSDFDMMYYHPRTIQKINTMPDWEQGRGDWNWGKDLYKEYDLEHQIMDDSIRLFAEECDTLQGFQVIFDTTNFGAFTFALLEAIADDYPKAVNLSFPIMSGVPPFHDESDTMKERIYALQDIICWKSLNEFSSQSVPLQPPSAWKLERLSKHVDFELDNMYQSSAVLSAHVETATLPLRIREQRMTLVDLCSDLNREQNTRFSHLTGILPYTIVSDEDDDKLDLQLDEQVYDFTHVYSIKRTPETLIQRSVMRGLSKKAAASLEEHFIRKRLREPFVTSRHLPAYPLPKSFPKFFRPPYKPLKQRLNLHDKYSPTVRSIPIYSALSTVPSTARVTKAYWKFVDGCVRKRMYDTGGTGIDRDEMLELGEDLAAIKEGYEGFLDPVEGEEENEEELGEDEDY